MADSSQLIISLILGRDRNPYTEYTYYDAVNKVKVYSIAASSFSATESLSVP